MKYLKKLGSRGHAHLVVPVIAIAIIGAIGTYLLTMSHADTPGGQIAFIDANNSALYVENSDGSNQHLVYKGDVGFGQPVWNKDGTSLIFAGSDGIYTINENGLNLKQLTFGSNTPAGPNNQINNDSNPSWSPDGTKILFQRWNSCTPPDANGASQCNMDVYVMNSDGSNVQQISTGAQDQDPSWSPDGTKILYHQVQPNNYGVSNPGWVTASADGTNIQPLNLGDASGFYNNSTASWSPDGNTIMLTGGGWEARASNNDTSACTIKSYDVASATVKQIYSYANNDCSMVNGSWSPNSQSFTFSMFPWAPTDGAGGANSNYDGIHIYTISADGSSLHQLPTNGLAHPAFPAWGPLLPAIYAASCSITNLPTSVSPNTAITPVISVTNTGTMPITPTLMPLVSVNGAINKIATSSAGQIAPGATTSVTVSSYTVPATPGSATYTVQSGDGTSTQATFTCNQNFTIVPGALTAPTPTVSGTAKVGYTLTANAGTWTAGTTLKYQWYANGVAISGATASTYKLAAAQLGKAMTVKVTGALSGYNATTTTSAATAAVAAGTLTAPTPTISGTLKAGYTLTANPGTWTAGTTLKYQWYANGVAISGATAKTFKLTTAQRTKKMVVHVTGSQAGYTTVMKSSAATVAVQ